MRIKKEIYYSILTSVKDIPPESGGILGEKDGIIQFVVYDEGVKNEKLCSYAPNVEKLNVVIQKWQEEGILFCGMFHTHFFGVETLSEGDVNYINMIMEQMPEDIKTLFFPIIVLPQRKFVVYVANREQKTIQIKKENIVIEGGMKYAE